MNKIEELKAQIETEKAAKQNYNESHAHRVNDLKKQIAALEAEASKPRELTAYLTPNNVLTTCRYFQDAFTLHGENTPITVIEKKPVRVTKVMGNIAQEAQDAQCYNLREPKGLVDVLNAIGIDAVVADE